MRYTRPTLVEYGRIEELTLTGGNDARDVPIVPLRRRSPPPPPRS